MSKGNALMAVTAIVGLTITCLAYLKERRKFEEVRDEKMDQALDKEIYAASHGSKDLTVEERSQAREILEHYRYKCEHAFSLREFDLAYKNLRRILDQLDESKPAEEKKSSIAYEYGKLQKREEEYQRGRERAARLEDIRAMGKMISNFVPDINVKPVTNVAYDLEELKRRALK